MSYPTEYNNGYYNNCNNGYNTNGYNGYNSGYNNGYNNGYCHNYPQQNGYNYNNPANGYYYETEYQPVSAMGWLIAAYITAILGGWLSVVLGVYIFAAKTKISDYEKAPKYIYSHRVAGIIAAVLGAVSMLIWISM